MDISSSCKTESRKGKRKWTEEEDKALIRVIKSMQKLNWNEIAEELRKEGNWSKTGKQCRERFRNYADPALERCEWKPNEKLLFLVLHRIYDNQWCNISKYLIQRSDIAIKNYFYTTVRKALKYYRTKGIPQSVISKPAKFYQTYTTLELLRDDYIPSLAGTVTHSLHKEKIILRLLRERKVTKEEMTGYLTLISAKFTELHAKVGLPVRVVVNLPELGVTGSRAEELVKREFSCNKEPLSQLVLLKITNGKTVEQIRSPSITPNVTAPSMTPPFAQFTASSAHSMVRPPPMSFPFPLPWNIYGLQRQQQTMPCWPQTYYAPPMMLPPVVSRPPCFAPSSSPNPSTLEPDRKLKKEL